MNLNAEFDDVFKLLGIASAAETVEQARSFATDAAVALRNRMAALAALPQPGAVEPEELEALICDRSANRAADAILAEFVLTRRALAGKEGA